MANLSLLSAAVNSHSWIQSQNEALWESQTFLFTVAVFRSGLPNG